MSAQTYIPDGFYVVSLDADGKEIDDESAERIENLWTDTLGDSVDELIIPVERTLITFWDPDIKQNVTVTKRSLALLQLDVIEEPSQHEWVPAVTVRKQSGSGLYDMDMVTNPWADQRDVANNRYEYREPIAHPADRAGSPFLGNLAEKVAYAYGAACNACNIVLARNGSCFC